MGPWPESSDTRRWPGLAPSSRTHVVAPNDKTEHTDGYHRHHHTPTTEDGAAGVVGQHLANDAKGGQNKDVDFGMQPPTNGVGGVDYIINFPPRERQELW